MPMDPSKYPADWPAISFRIRVDRADNQCECPGYCGHDHEAEYRHKHKDPFMFRCLAVNYKPHPITGSNVVLTVAHLDHDTSNNDDANLCAMCQRCHLAYDSAYHRKNAAETRRKGQISAGQLSLPWEVTHE